MLMGRALLFWLLFLLFSDFVFPQAQQKVAKDINSYSSRRRRKVVYSCGYTGWKTIPCQDTTGDCGFAMRMEKKFISVITANYFKVYMPIGKAFLYLIVAC